MERENVLLFLTTVQIAATALYTAWKLRKNKRWRSRRWWVRPIMARREEHGDFATLFQELKEDPVLFFRYTRMNVSTFYELLHLISPHITKRSARPSISAEQRLAITLRFLATGDQVLSIALAFRIGESTAHEIIKETCILAVVCLHNFLKTKNDEQPAQARQYCPPKFVDTDTGNGEVVPGEWRENREDNNLLPMGNIGAHRAAKEAYEIRDRLASYFITPTGQVPWQYDYIQGGKNQN
ncbi:hypothetical protein NQ314_017862 [Rhamnusium bicolor]|uniref:Nuclease HARBI1 n=1 Tax=Rhamnusium bicolor TaxID=1586634 RepID=A0AAV8WTG0_9CUCU|nr:hypothetical protein NQ314_017862 [Rhamnusium bicolor]